MPLAARGEPGGTEDKEEQTATTPEAKDARTDAPSGEEGIAEEPSPDDLAAGSANGVPPGTEDTSLVGVPRADIH